jgi:hypothetical protein
MKSNLGLLRKKLVDFNTVYLPLGISRMAKENPSRLIWMDKWYKLLCS